MVKPLTDVTTGLYIITVTCGLVDAVCFLALGGVFAEMMTGNLLLMALSLGTGNALGDTTRYLPAMFAFMLGALLGGRLLRGPKKLQEWRAGFAVEWLIMVVATIVAWRPAGGDNRNWRRRGLSVGLFVAGAALGAFLLKFGVVWPLVATSLLFTVAMWPLLLGRTRTMNA